MLPILLNCAASLASDVIDTVSDKLSSSKTQNASATAQTDFSSVLDGAQQTPAAKAAAAALQKQAQQTQLMNTVLNSPEVATAMAQANPSQPVQVELSAQGQVSLRAANGALTAVKLSNGTQMAAQQLYGSHNPAASLTGPAPARASVLVVDPSHAAAPAWSSLPPRS